MDTLRHILLGIAIVVGAVLVVGSAGYVLTLWAGQAARVRSDSSEM